MCEHDGKPVRPRLWKGGHGLYKCPKCGSIWVKTLDGFVPFRVWQQAQER